MRSNFLENTVFGFHIKFRHINKKLYAFCYVSFIVSVSYLMRQTHCEFIYLASLYNFVMNYIYNFQKALFTDKILTVTN